MKAIDLHVHSNKSDGTYSPSELVEYAIEKGLAAIALTDHDTIDGLDEIMEYAESLRRKQTAQIQLQNQPQTKLQSQSQTQPQNQPQMSPQNHSSANTVPKNIPCGLLATKNRLAEHPADRTIPESIPRIIPEIIPGIEFSTEYEGKDVHILGLYIDYKSEAFRKPLQDFVASRIARNEKMCRLLQGAGIHITFEKLQAEYPESVITRAHYASYLLKYGYTKSLKEAFERYVGDHCPYFVPREKVTPEQAVQLVLSAKGIPILAHPPLYHMSDGRLDKLVSNLRDAGLMGIEAIYSTYSSGEERAMRKLAAKYDLLISGGSDFHGANKKDLDLGTGYGKLYVDYSVLEKIKNIAFKS